MSAKRLNKRQLREQQELEQLALASSSSAPAATTADQPAQDQNTDDDRSTVPNDQDEQDDSDDDITSTPVAAAAKRKGKKNKKQQPAATASLFAALGEGEEDEQDDDQEGQDSASDDAAAQHTQTAAKKKKNKKKKKKPSPAAAAAEEGAQEDGGQDGDASRTAASTQAKPGSQQSKKKAAGKKGASSGTAAGKDVDDMSMDELNALLESQAKIAAEQQAADAKAGGGGGSVSVRPPPVSSFRTHLSLDPRNLDPAIELRRQFGSAAIKAFENENSGGASAGARARAQATNSNLKLRSLLSQPKDYWPPIGRTFTGMNMDVRDTRSGRICSWQHGKAYRQVQLQFLQAVRSYDPNSLMALLRVYPWHIDTLLQLSDYSRHQGDLGQAADFNSRALFAFERTASPYFVSCLSSSTSGPPLVDFLKIENRAFYLAVHRNLGFLGRRGTWRTALEWSKILLGLGKDGEDHHAALLWIDFLAVKAKQARWLVALCEKLDLQRGQQRGGGVKRVEEISVRAATCIDDERADAGESDGWEGTLDWCVGLQYARALALRAVEKEEKDKSGRRSRAALRLAIARHPMAVPLLANKIGLDLPSHIAVHPLFQSCARYGEGEGSDSLPHLLSQIYALRSESLWKEPGYPEWLRDTAVELFPTLTADYDAGSKSKRRPALADQKTRQGIYRHVLVSDLPDNVRQQLIAHLPPEVTANSEMMDAFDPIPPVSRELYSRSGGGGGGEDEGADEGRATRYDDDYFAPVMATMGGGGGGRGARDVAAAAAAAGGGGEGLMQAFMRALQGVGGMRGWDEAMQNMDDETREDVMAQILEMTAQARQQRGAEVDEPPGGFGAIGGGDGGDDDGVVDGDEAAMGQGGGGAFAAIRNALNAVWGAGGTARRDAEDLDEEEEEGEWEEEEENDDHDDEDEARR